MKNLDVCQGLRLVATDLLRRHFLVYDAAYKKIGSLDCCRGVWTFTLVATNETWFGYSRNDALNSYLRFPDTPSSPCTVLAFLG